MRQLAMPWAPDLAAERIEDFARREAWCEKWCEHKDCTVKGMPYSPKCQLGEGE